LVKKQSKIIVENFLLIIGFIYQSGSTDFSKLIKNKTINKQTKIRIIERGFEKTLPRTSDKIPKYFNTLLKKGELSNKRANDIDITTVPTMAIPIQTKS